MGHYRIPDHVNQVVLGHYPGETFAADLSPQHEARLLASGAITVVGGLSSLTRDQLNELASKKRIESPGDLATKDDVIAAIEASETTTEKE